MELEGGMEGAGRGGSTGWETGGAAAFGWVAEDVDKGWGSSSTVPPGWSLTVRTSTLSSS